MGNVISVRTSGGSVAPWIYPIPSPIPFGSRMVTTKTHDSRLIVYIRRAISRLDPGGGEYTTSEGSMSPVVARAGFCFTLMAVGVVNLHVVLYSLIHLST